jgi:lysine 2,3-aminomutase
LVANVCDAYCRFCFRKRLFTGNETETSLDVSAGIQYIAAHPEITNVLLTGGDPLVLSTRRLDQILTALRQIPHVRIIRIGTKSLAFNPQRVLQDATLPEVLARHSLPDRRIYIMAHFDHPRELTTQSIEAIKHLQQAGCTVVHQCPLLRGINDTPETLAQLLEGLAAIGVTPYYLFQNRPVLGNAGFVVPLAEGYRIAEAAKHRLSGLAKRFRYVMSHATGKVEILAVEGDQIFLKYHQARDARDEGRLIISYLSPEATWLDDLPGFKAAQD